MTNRYQSRWMQDFAGQLLRGPKRLRMRQLLGIDFLFSVVEPGKQYPGEFVVHALTGYRAPVVTTTHRNAAAVSPMLSADTLRRDLAELAEHLSEDAAMPVEAYDGRLYSVEDLARRFHVSTKTIFRWRRRGLVGWKFRFADHRVRLVFADRCVRRFVAEHSDLVQRGSHFSQLTLPEREQIVSRASELVGAGHKTANSVARVISQESGRAVETIRLILRSHDESHPGAGVFNRSAVVVPVDEQRLALWSAYCDGAGVSELAARFRRPLRWVYAAVTQMRAIELRRTPIEYLPSADFEQPNADDAILKCPALAQPYRTDEKPSRAPASLPPYLQQLFSLPLLSAAGERALFCKMNYLKFKAARLQSAVDPQTTTAAELDRIEALLDEAAVVKNQITKANLRLVVSIAKRHAQAHVDFFELISDGNVSLMRAVDKFDYSRGFKFSTYGSWAIMKNFARSVPDENSHRERYQTGQGEFLGAMPAAAPPDEAEDDHRLAVRNALEQMLQSLEPRDRQILLRRFGVDNHGEPQTLEEIGRTLGVSKERVRQLELRAVLRLREEYQADVSRLLGT